MIIAFNVDEIGIFIFTYIAIFVINNKEIVSLSGGKMEKDLTKGRILKILVNLAIPIMATSLLNMTYNMIDIFWLGRLGNSAVASVGTAGFYINLGYAILAVAFISGGITVAHNLGSKNRDGAKRAGENAIALSIFLSITYILMVLIFKEKLIGFFGLEREIVVEGISYLNIAIWSVLFTSLTMTMSRIMNSYGNSKIPFFISSLGLVMNIILDPLFIFTFKLGVLGAALATVISNIVVVFIFFRYLIKKYDYFLSDFSLDKTILKSLIKLGLPVTIQRTLFTLIAIIIGKMLASFGSEGISAHRIGLQLESISFMTAGGFQGALAAFIGQNYGAKKYDRIKKGYFTGIGIISFGAFLMALVFYYKGDFLVSLFIEKEEVIKIGSSYMKIIAFSQIFMVWEISTVGAFNGLGKTLIPSVNSVLFTALRIPMAFFLMDLYGIDGIWLSITLSSIIKGSALTGFFYYRLKKLD